MDSKTEPASDLYKMDNEKEINRIIEDADKYGFSVPYDGTSEFYDRSAIKAYIAGATAEYNRAQEEITRLKEDLEMEREMRKEAFDIFKGLISQRGFRGGFPHTTTFIEALIEKAKN